MKISLNWIKQYVDLPDNIDMESLSHKLTMTTVEVEGTENLKEELKNIVAGKIIEVSPHPQADRLRITKVDIGEEEPLQIVCGGSNLYENQMVVIAKVGSFVKWHGEGDKVEIKPAKLRGVPSSGMICGASEIGMEDLFPVPEEHMIMDISNLDAKPGQEISSLLGLDDIILEIDNKSLTNRPDLWGHYGIAREIAAIYKKELKPLEAFTKPTGVDTYKVEIKNPEICNRYVGTVYENIKIEESPMWLKIALWKVGLRPINNIVDITNYVMLATGQPTHAFDKSHVDGGIVVRLAKDNEKLLLLDDTELELSNSDLVIADEKKALGLAGIMGGKNDSIFPTTKDIVFEVANFKASNIRHTSNTYGVRTESSMRFEKGIDVDRIDISLKLANDLLHDIVDGVKITSYCDNYPVKNEEVKVNVTLDYLKTRLGRDISTKDVEELLKPLGFKCDIKGENIEVIVPSYRGTGDVNLPDDILEEVARMIGYDNFTYVPPRITLEEAINQKEYDVDRNIREYLSFRCGLQEVFTYPWTDISYIKAAGLEGEENLLLAAPPSPDLQRLRSSLVPGILEVINKNIRYFDTFKVFESTQVYKVGEFSPDREDEVLPIMERNVTCAIVGEDATTVIREAKGIVEMMPRYIMVEGLTFKQVNKPAWSDKKAYLNIMFNDEVIGSISLLSLKAMNLAGIKRKQVAIIDLNIEKLVSFKSRDNVFTHLPQFPLTHKDLSLLIDENTPWGEIETIVKPMVNELNFIEEYRGKQIPEGKKSITLSVSFGSNEGTLTNDQIEEKMNSIIKKLTKKLNAEVRGV